MVTVWHWNECFHRNDKKIFTRKEKKENITPVFHDRPNFCDSKNCNINSFFFFFCLQWNSAFFFLSKYMKSMHECRMRFCVSARAIPIKDDFPHTKYVLGIFCFMNAILSSSFPDCTWRSSPGCWGCYPWGCLKGQCHKIFKNFFQ